MAALAVADAVEEAVALALAEALALVLTVALEVVALKSVPGSPPPALVGGAANAAGAITRTIRALTANETVIFFT